LKSRLQTCAVTVRQGPQGRDRALLNKYWRQYSLFPHRIADKCQFFASATAVSPIFERIFSEDAATLN